MPIAARTAALLLLLLAAPAARAQIELGVRLGAAAPLGEQRSGASLAGFQAFAIPFQLDLLQRLSPQVAAGAYFGWAWARPGDDVRRRFSCEGGVSCSGSSWRLGLQAVFRPLELGAVRPWLGVATGVETSGVVVSGGGRDLQESVRGWEFLTLQLGADLPLAGEAAIGLFLSGSIGQYDRYDTSGTGSTFPDASGTVPSPSPHGWLQLGLRGLIGI